MAEQKFSFISLEMYDSATGSVISELYLEEINPCKLTPFLKEAIISLKKNEARDIGRRYLVDFPEFSDALEIWKEIPIRLRHESSEVSCRVHGGRELDLIHRKVKPLSVFSDVRPRSAYANFLSKYFDALVAEGKLSFCELAEPDLPPRLLYALPGEEWRFNAYKLMRVIARNCRWNDTLERMEGSLLGYTPEQNDQHLECRARKGLRWGCQAVYSYLSDEEAEFVRKTGGKAFSTDLVNSMSIYLPRYVDEETEAVDVLMTSRRHFFAQFFVRIVDFLEFPSRKDRIGGLEFDVFDLTGPELIYLNNKIDGTIDIIGGDK
jgi:hypothetical protein